LSRLPRVRPCGRDRYGGELRRGLSESIALLRGHGGGGGGGGGGERRGERERESASERGLEGENEGKKERRGEKKREERRNVIVAGREEAAFPLYEGV